MTHMNFGAPSLSRLHCRKCHEETIHSNGRCIHCKTMMRGWKVREETWYEMSKRRKRENMREIRRRLYDKE